MELYIKTFGKFCILIDGKPAFEYTGRTKKLWNLLEYMIVNRNAQTTQKDLIKVAGLTTRSDCPENALKNLMYRLRLLLAESNLPEKDYILCGHGTYYWNRTIECVVDCEEFEKEWKTAGNSSLDEAERLEHYQAAIDLYQGYFLTKSARENWVVPLSAYYHRIFCDCVNSSFRLRSHNGNYESMVDVCQLATSLDPYNEKLNELYILTLVKLNRHKEALQVYNEFIEKLYKEVGVNPSENISNLYQEIIKTLNNVQLDINMVKNDLREANDNVRGAYFCQYEIFKYMYRFLARSIPRTGQSVFLVLLTVSDSNGETPSVKLLNASMKILHESIMTSLRMGDVFARYSNTQYVIMLPSLNYENGKMVVKRILSNFNCRYRNKKIIVNYMLQPLDPMIRE